MKTLCRDCARLWVDAGDGDARCPECGGRRLYRHSELDMLSIAHIDCDAFYAAIEKRDDSSLVDKPVIVGGGKRGVVSAACYVARIHGVRSAMPMFKALKACPDAVVLRPNMTKYAEAGQQVRDIMKSVTPAVEPLSVDEAFLDLTGTERVHKAAPAQTLARLVLRIEREVGVTASIGLSYNKFLAKVASDLDKPRGLAAIGRAEARRFLAEQPVGMIWGVGQSLQKKLAAHGITRIGQLQAMEEKDLLGRYGAIGSRLYRFSRGEDARRVIPDAPAKSISAEITFSEDIAAFDALQARLWPLCEKVSRRLKKSSIAGRTVVLKLKTARFRTLTRNRQLAAPTQLAEVIYRTALPLLKAEATGEAFRLIGIGVADLRDPETADPLDLLDPNAEKRAEVERAMDAVRAKLGDDAIRKGRGLGDRTPD